VAPTKQKTAKIHNRRKPKGHGQERQALPWSQQQTALRIVSDKEAKGKTEGCKQASSQLPAGFAVCVKTASAHLSRREGEGRDRRKHISKTGRKTYARFEFQS